MLKNHMSTCKKTHVNMQHLFLMGKEETFFSASRSRIFCFFHVVDVRSVVKR